MSTPRWSNRLTTPRAAPYKGDASYHGVPSGGMKSVNAVWTYEAPFAAVAEIKGHVAFYPERVDAIIEQSPA